MRNSRNVLQPELNVLQVNLWPCYDAKYWQKTNCTCEDDLPTCQPLHPKEIWPDRGYEPPNPKLNLTENPCVCQSVSYGCLRMTTTDIPWWDPRARPTAVTPLVSTTMDPKLLNSQGFGVNGFQFSSHFFDVHFSIWHVLLYRQLLESEQEPGV